MKKSIWIALVSFIALALALTGCGGGATSGGTSGGASEEVTLHFMHLWPEGSSRQQYMIVNKIIEEFENEYPHITIEEEVLENEQYKNKLKVVSTSNSLPDIGMTWPAGFLEPYVKGELFAPLDDLLADGLKDDFVGGTTEAYAIDGQTYALPLELNIVPVYYNKAIFEQYDLEVPETYDEFRNIVDTLVANGVAPIALGNRDRWTGSLWFMYLADRIGGDALARAIDRSGSFTDESLVRAAAEVQELVHADAFNRGFNGLSNDEGKAEFINEQAAMYLMGTWEVPNFTTNEEIPQEFRDSVGFFKFPVVEGGKGNIDSWVGGPGVGLFVAENSPAKEEAKLFVRYFVERWGAHSMTEAGVIPGTKVDTANIDLPPLYIELLNELNNASNITLFADVQMSPGTAETHLTMIQSLFGLEIEPEQFAQVHEDALASEHSDEE